MLSRPIGPRRIVAPFVLAITLIVFGLQLRSLYTVPVFDSVRWGGDETWLMREFGNQARHGLMAYPETFGGPVRTDGVLAGSMWADALLYGASGFVFFPSYDYGTIGRTVTAILSLLLIASLYYLLRKLGVSSILASASVALMVLCQGFMWATHSSRYDLLTGLTLIWYCYYLSKSENASRKHLLATGMLAVFIICFSRHLLLLGLPATLVYLYHERVWRQLTRFISWLAGAIVAAIVLSFLYAMGAHEFSLFGRGGAEGSYSFVIGQIPILRPFSRNVQISNLEERLYLFASDSPGILIVVAIAIALAALYKVRQWQVQRRGVHLRIVASHSQRFLLACSVLCLLSWILTEGSRPYYLFHIVPLLVIGCAIVLELWSEVYPARWFGETTALLLLAGTIAVGAKHAIPNTVLGDAIARDQSSAIPRLLAEADITESRKSRILLDVAGLDRALTDTSHEVLTLDMFQPPSKTDALVRKLQENRIDYVLLRSSPVSSPFEPGRALLPRVLDSIGELRDSALGFFYDDGRSYDASLSTLIDQGLDTLKLYRVP